MRARSSTALASAQAALPVQWAPHYPGQVVLGYQAPNGSQAVASMSDDTFIKAVGVAALCFGVGYGISQLAKR